MLKNAICITSAVFGSLLVGGLAETAQAQYARDAWHALTPVDSIGGGGAVPPVYPDPGGVGTSRGNAVPLPNPFLLGASGLGLVIVVNRRRRS